MNEIKRKEMQRETRSSYGRNRQEDAKDVKVVQLLALQLPGPLWVGEHTVEHKGHFLLPRAAVAPQARSVSFMLWYSGVRPERK